MTSLDSLGGDLASPDGDLGTTLPIQPIGPLRVGLGRREAVFRSIARIVAALARGAFGIDLDLQRDQSPGGICHGQ